MNNSFCLLSKLGGPYLVFVSAFYSTMDSLGPSFSIPTFDDFSKQLTHEKDKLIQMGYLSSEI